MSKPTNRTVKGQGTIQGRARRAGPKPNEPVEIDWQGGDEAVIRKPASAGRFDNLEEQLRYFASLRVAIRDVTPVAARRAGRAHRAYRRAGGERSAVLAHFPIGRMPSIWEPP